MRGSIPEYQDQIISVLGVVGWKTKQNKTVKMEGGEIIVK